MPADPEVPEADALDQAQPAEPDAGEPAPAPRKRMAFEVPEADALDQTREVPLDDDDRR
jgi:hypothetical protein